MIGSITLNTGISSFSDRNSYAIADAELHAITIIFAPFFIK
jgi:hypothetical protein